MNEFDDAAVVVVVYACSVMNIHLITLSQGNTTTMTKNNNNNDIRSKNNFGE